MRTLFFILLLLLSIPSQNVKHRVDVIKIDGAINPVVADFLHDVIEQANKEKAECLIIELNTPGGLLKSTRMIVSDFLTSKVPIVIFVSPSGAQAASAGVFITLAANIAVMSPGTNIGAAHPVMITEGNQPNKKDSTDIMMEKATNDAAAFIRSIAEKRHRNIEWAEKAVRQSVALSESEALKEKIIDFVAKDLDDLLVKLDGYSAETLEGLKTINTKDAAVNHIEMNIVQKILDIISDPNIAYILMMIGIYGLIFELSNPGSILPGIVGFISLVLAFYSLHTLPINYAGLGLIIFAVILFIAEVKVMSHGLLTAGGIISFLVGSLMLINTDISFEFIRLSLVVIITVTILTTLFFVFAIGKGIAAQRRRPTTGSEGLIGERGFTLSGLKPNSVGQIMLHGEIWNAECSDEVDKNTKVEVVGIKELNLLVKKLNRNISKT